MEISSLAFHRPSDHIFYFLFFGQSGGASRWRVCYQRGLTRLVPQSTLNQSVNQSVSDGGDCRTAPARQGLLNFLDKNILQLYNNLKLNKKGGRKCLCLMLDIVL